MPDKVAVAMRLVPESRRARLAVASLVCGLGLAVSGVTLVRASDDLGLFGFLRGTLFDRAVDPVRLRPRYASEPRFVVRPAREVRRREAARRVADVQRPGSRGVDARRPRLGGEGPDRRTVARQGRLALAAMSTAPGRQTVCVRTCDGYLFPVGTLHSRGDIETHRTACSAACPGADTQLYTLSGGRSLEDPSRARSVLDGKPYGTLGTAFLFRRQTVASCECQPPGRIASHLPILLDPTLRRGDVVVDGDGEARAFAGRRIAAFGDYETSDVLSRQAKAQVDRLMGTSVRRRVAADFARGERERLAAVGSPAEAARPGRTRHAMREVAPPAGSGIGVRAFTVVSSGGTVHASGARIITIQ